ncbi:MAG: ATP-binding protein [Bacteroidales bacterium]
MENIKRVLMQDIVNHLDKKEITIITGARQVGKSTMLNEIMLLLKARGLSFVYFNLDFDNHFNYFKTQETLLQKIGLETDTTGTVFIDEIQRLPDAGLFLKGLFDRNTGYKFVVTGSGSLELKEKIHESLAGRKRMFNMDPVSFIEFVNFKTGYKYENKLPDFFSVETHQTLAYLDEYLNYGGYPRIITESSHDEKLKLMDEIFRSYIEKDLVFLLKIEHPGLFRLLIRLLAINFGQISSYNELALKSGISVSTLKKYLWYAEKTFCIYPVTPYFSNKLKEITKSPVFYFNDLGLRNFAIGQMGQLFLNEQMGFLFQNFVFHVLRERIKWSNQTIHYWRTTDKAEVDFVINGNTGLLPVEVKNAEIKKPVITRSLRSFIEKYNPQKAWIINRNYTNQVIINKTVVLFKPFYNLL